MSILLMIMLCSKLHAQVKDLPRDPFFQLDSLAHSPSIGKHFGELYFVFLYQIEQQVHNLSPQAQVLVRKFENIFADFYVDACRSWQNKEQIEVKEWKAYFVDSSLQPVQYKLLGTNAHLNGGLWQALAHSFTQEEMNGLKKEFVIFKKSLNQTYKLVYNEAIESNRKARFLHQITLGVTRWLGNWYLYKWRKRQMRLARYHWNGSSKFTALEKKVERKKKKIDVLIVEWLREG